MEARRRVIRIGVLGSESSHVDAFVRHFSIERRFDGMAITDVLAASPERDTELRALGLRVRDRLGEFLDDVDAVMVTHRDGSTHADLAASALERGLPTFVDKPLATSRADADALARIARDTPLMSGSVFHWHSEVLRLARALSPGAAIEVVGTAQPTCEHAGIFFYGIHAAETAATLVGVGDWGRVTVDRRPGQLVLRASAGAGEVTVRLLDEPPGRRPLLVTTDGGVTVLDLDQDYLMPVSERFAAMLLSGEAPGLAHAVAGIELLEAAAETP